MNHRLWIAVLSILILSGPAVEWSPAQLGSPNSVTADPSAVPGGAPQSSLRRPDPKVVGNYSPGMGPPVAMLGYSPVSLLNERQWVKGREQYKVVFDGATYWLADQREMQTFRVAPERYLPALGGDCVVHFVNTGERKGGLLRHGVVHENRLFFLSSSENKQALVDNPERYMNADLALDGNCPVCLVELSQAIPGQPELAVVLGGYRYLFPGAQQREMFLAQPRKYAAAAHAISGEGLPMNSSRPAVASESRSSTSPSPQAGGTADSAPAESSPAEGDLPPPVSTAMAGYCPVTILQENRWVRGRAEYALVFDGRRYLFAGGEQRTAFLDNPTAFVPALGGDCVVTFKDLGQRIEGSVFHAVIHRGRQFLLSGRPQKDNFKQNPDAYADVDLALGGLCAVRLAEAGERVEGSPEFTSWHEGFRYQLAGREELDRFEENPRKYAREAGERMQGAAADTRQLSDNPFE